MQEKPKQTGFWDKAGTEQKLSRQFADLASYSATDKTAISIRDGVLEYLGSELGLEPADKIFTVYRSPATIANAAHAMPGIPLTDEHIGLDIEPPDTGSRVTESHVIDSVDDVTRTRLAVRNKLSVSDAALPMLDSKRQLSLGYMADLVPHSEYDFEQVDIVPHHLAAVSAGRCGPLCSFLDRKPPTQTESQEDRTMPKIHKAFQDADGAVSLEQIVEIATALPEAIKKVPVDKLTELMPAMQEVMSYAKEQGAMPESEEEEQMTDEEKEKAAAEAAAAAKDEGENKFADSLGKVLGKKVKDADGIQSAIEKHRSDFADAEVKKYAAVVNKARDFLDEDYDFSDKTANEVMRDALATQSTDKFEDSELDIAFKMLRKSSVDYSRFGDSKPEGALSARIKETIKES